MIPTILYELISDSDPEKAQRTMEAMMSMSKMDIDRLKRAHQGG